MMKLGYWQRYRPKLLSHGQRGALEPPASEPSSTLDDLGTQAEQIEARIHHLKTGINNIRQLQNITDASDRGEAQRAEAQAELNQLQQAVDDFELSLASHLLSWKQFQEPFWQAVRYGGLGLVGGWVLHWLVRG